MSFLILHPPPRYLLPVVSTPVRPDGATKIHLKERAVQERVLALVDYSAADNLLRAPREVDSGITALETPLAAGDASSSSAASSTSGSPVSTASAPATASSSNTGSVGPASAAIPPTPSTPGVPNAHPVVLASQADHAKRQDDFAMAQLVHPARACVFVGNLPANLSDAELSQDMMNRFRGIGSVTVSIQRQIVYSPTWGSHIEKPWALLQYEHPLHAYRAIDDGNTEFVEGRQLRVTLSTARRDLCVVRNDGGYPYPKELYANFHRFGEIENIFVTVRGYVMRFWCYGSYALAKNAVTSGNLYYHLG